MSKVFKGKLTTDIRYLDLYDNVVNHKTGKVFSIYQDHASDGHRVNLDGTTPSTSSGHFYAIDKTMHFSLLPCQFRVVK